MSPDKASHSCVSVLAVLARQPRPLQVSFLSLCGFIRSLRRSLRVPASLTPHLRVSLGITRHTELTSQATVIVWGANVLTHAGRGLNQSQKFGKSQSNILGDKATCGDSQQQDGLCGHPWPWFQSHGCRTSPGLARKKNSHGGRAPDRAPNSVLCVLL